MKFCLSLRSIVSLVFLAVLVTGCPGGDGPYGIRFDIVEKKLSNGLKILMVEDHTVPVISYQTWVKVGSVDEYPGITGMSHLFEHLMFKGTDKYGAKQFFQQLEAKGAEVNAFTTRDYTVYYENFTPNLLEKVIDMESDRFANIRFDEKDLRAEREVVLEERRLRTDNSPAGQMNEALWGLAFRRHPYRYPVIGVPTDLFRVEVKDLEDFFKKYYHPGNLTLVLVGDFDADKTYEMIKEKYGPIPAGKRPERRVPREFPQNSERRIRLSDKIAAEKFMQAYHVTSAHQDDSYALDVLANILFYGTSSRVYQRMVERDQIVISINGSAYTPSYPGLFLINGTMKGDLKTEVAEKALHEEIRRVQDELVTKEEIDVAVRQLLVQVVDSIGTPYGLGQLIGTVSVILGNPEKYQEELKKYLKVTREDVKRVANQYLNPNNRTTVVMGPEIEDKDSKKAGKK